MATPRLTTGLTKALGKLPMLQTCDNCGFPMPRYPGRYPSKCPVCQQPREVALPAPKDQP